MQIKDLATAISAELVGDPDFVVTRLVHPSDAEDGGDLAIAMSQEAYAGLAASKARAAIVKPSVVPPMDLAALLIAGGDERAILSRLTTLFDRGPVHGEGIHPSAVVAPDAILGPRVSIGPLSNVGSRSAIGADSIMLGSVTIGAEVQVGEGALLYPGVRIYDRVRIGNRVIVHANSVIGSSGFSYIPARPPDGSAGHNSLPTPTRSLGSVVIGDDVEIGAGTTIDRGTLRDTRIGSGTKIDNLVQIGHNVIVGEACLICGQAGISGSVTLGDRVIVAGGVGIADHLDIGSDAMLAAGSGVVRDVPSGGRFIGYPAHPREKFAKQYLNIGRLTGLYKRVEEIEKRIGVLKKGPKLE